MKYLAQIIIFKLIILICSCSYFLGKPKAIDKLENRVLANTIEFSFNEFYANSFQIKLESYLLDQFKFRKTSITIKNIFDNLFKFNYNSPFINKDFIYTNGHLIDRIKILRSNSSFVGWETLSNDLKKLNTSLDMIFIRKEDDFYFSNLNKYMHCNINLDEIKKYLVNINHIFLGKEVNAPSYYYKSDHHINRFGSYFVYDYFMTKHNYKPIAFSDFKYKKKAILRGSKTKISGFDGVYDEYYAPKNNKAIELYIDNNFYKFGYLNDKIIQDKFTNWNTYTETPGYCSCDKPKGNVINYSYNKNAANKENILLIGDSQQCGVAFMFYNSFEYVYNMDHRTATNSIKKYVNDYNISHVIYIGNIANTFSNKNIINNWLK